MTFTWDPTTLATSELQQVRLTIGDKDSNKPLLTDEEIEFRLDQHGDIVLPTAVDCVGDILAKLARDVDRNNVGMSATRSQQVQHYQDLLKELKAQAGTVCEAYVGGTSDSEADTINSNSDYRQIGITMDWGKNNG